MKSGAWGHRTGPFCKPESTRLLVGARLQQRAHVIGRGIEDQNARNSFKTLKGWGNKCVKALSKSTRTETFRSETLSEFS
jgi:hypothetical protein